MPCRRRCRRRWFRRGRHTCHLYVRRWVLAAAAIRLAPVPPPKGCDWISPLTVHAPISSSTTATAWNDDARQGTTSWRAPIVPSARSTQNPPGSSAGAVAVAVNQLLGNQQPEKILDDIWRNRLHKVRSPSVENPIGGPIHPPPCSLPADTCGGHVPCLSWWGPPSRRLGIGPPS